MAAPRTTAFLLGGCLLAVLVGCGGHAPVEGRVTLDGQAVEGAAVYFRPGAVGEDAGGITDADGRFRLNGPKAEGVLPGLYWVTVSKKQYPPGMKVPSAKEMSFALSAKMIEVLPKRYTLPDKTPLRVEVPRGGKKDVLVELEKN